MIISLAMNLPPQPKHQQPTPEMREFAEPPKEPLELLLDIAVDSQEAESRELLSLTTVETETAEPIQAGPLSAIAQLSQRAIAFFTDFAEINLDSISDAELQPARIRMGLTFIGFGGLAMGLLLVYSSSLHPELSPIERIREYWYPYIGFVCLGVAGMMMLGRELIRPSDRALNESDESKAE